MIKLLLLSALITHAAEAPSTFQKDAALFQSKCAKCHTLGRGDRVGPDLKGVSERRETAWLVGFITKTDFYLNTDAEAQKLLERFNGVRMENTGLSEAQAQGLLNYINAASKGPVGPEEPAEPEVQDPATKLSMPDEGRGTSWPGIALTLLLLALTAVTWQAGFAWPAALLLTVAVGTGYWSLGGRRYYRLLGDQQGYAPQQPIAYSHKTHAGKMKMDCLYCHYGATRSDVAGIPPLSLCMNCHGAVRKVAGATEPSVDIAQFISTWETRLSSAPKTIRWNKVHDMPDYAHFSHRVHVADNIKCQECHGPVQDMTHMRQASSLSMGWCIDCHRKTASEAPTHWKRSGGPLDCAACHW